MIGAPVAHPAPSIRGDPGLVYLLKLFHDDLLPNSSVLLQAQHSMIYVRKGSATINGNAVPADVAVYEGDGRNALALGTRTSLINA